MGKKVDEAIEAICDYIKELTKSQTLEAPMEVAENTKALALLVEARTQVSQTAEKFIPHDSNGVCR